MDGGVGGGCYVVRYEFLCQCDYVPLKPDTVLQWEMVCRCDNTQVKDEKTNIQIESFHLCPHGPLLSFKQHDPS